MYIKSKKQQIVSIYEQNMNNGALFQKKSAVVFYVKLKAGLSIIIPANDRYVVEANYYLFGRS